MMRSVHFGKTINSLKLSSTLVADIDPTSQPYSPYSKNDLKQLIHILINKLLSKGQKYIFAGFLPKLSKSCGLFS